MKSACTVSCSIRASELEIQCMGGECLNHRAGNSPRTLHSYISVTDEVIKLNK